MKYYLIAGEASGDWHASLLMKELKNLDQKAEFRFWGGNKMLEVDSNIVKHYNQTAFMGVWEVLKNLRKIRQNFQLCKKDIVEYHPDAVILIDYPAFNLRIAKYCKSNKIKNFYYIAPKVWAWNQKRVKKIKKYVDKLLVIFPFEENYFKKFSVNAIYVGNPTAYIIDKEKEKSFDKDKFLRENGLDDRKIIAVLPGSRYQEISKMLPIYSEASKNFEEYQFVVAGLSSLPSEYYKKMPKNFKIVWDKTYELLRCSYAALVTSGTATLETALWMVPQIVCYKTSFLTYLLGSILLKIKFISLVNIISGKKVVEEIIQKNMVQRVSEELKRITHDEEYRNKMIENYKELKNILLSDNPPKKAALHIINNL